MFSGFLNGNVWCRWEGDTFGACVWNQDTLFCFFPTAATVFRPNYAEFHSFLLLLKIHFRFRWGREQVAWGLPHYHVSIWMQMKNRFSINLLPRRPTLKVEHRAMNQLSSSQFSLIMTSCCAALHRKEEKSIISFSSHRLTGSQREASEKWNFFGVRTELWCGNFSSTTFSDVCFRLRVIHIFFSGVSKRELHLRTVFWSTVRTFDCFVFGVKL